MQAQKIARSNPNHLTILIIDDRRAQHDLYKAFLMEDSENQYEFLHAYSALDGLEIYREHDEIDCVLLDYKLPDINGIDVLESLSIDNENIAPVVMLTGHGNEMMAVTAIKTGAQDYISKHNVSSKSLQRSVNHAIEHNSMQRQLDKYRIELERSNKDLEDFAYIISHDLKSPLRAITQHIQLLAHDNMDTLDDDSKQSMKFVVDGAKRMHNLVDALLDFSRIRFEDAPEQEIDCNKMVQDVLDNLLVPIKDTGAIINFDNLPVINGNRAHILQLFQNLISNSIKFCDTTPEITIQASKEKEHWLFEFHDNGIGIPADKKDKVFTIFKRLHNEDEYKGTGVGLAICKRVVENHGGKIWYVPNPKKGTDFYFRLPIKEQD